MLPPSSKKSCANLQPTYFSSSIFIELLKADLNNLLDSFTHAVQQNHEKPFALFKQIWLSHGWQWMHFRTFDPRSRLGLLSTVLRILMENAAEQSLSPLHRVAALYAFYTFYCTQPDPEAPPLAQISCTVTPSDYLESIISLPDILRVPQFSFLAPTTIHIIRALCCKRAFYVVPCSTLCPSNPRQLPRFGLHNDELELDDDAVQHQDMRATTKQGQMIKAREGISELDHWLEANSVLDTASNPPTLIHSRLSEQPDTLRITYQTDKSRLLGSIGHQSHQLYSANQDTYARVRRIQEDAAKQGLEVGLAEVQGVGGKATALQRVEKAASEWASGQGGVLGLLDGCGWASLEDSVPASK